MSSRSTTITLRLAEGDYAMLQDALKTMEGMDMAMDKAEAHGEVDDRAETELSRAMIVVARITSRSVTGEMRRAIARHRKRLEAET